jgi:hypothetical protein
MESSQKPAIAHKSDRTTMAMIPNFMTRFTLPHDRVEKGLKKNE